MSFVCQSQETEPIISQELSSINAQWTIFIMTSHALRFLVVVVKIAPSVARSRESVKNQQKRHVGQLKASYQVFYKVMCSIATQIQRNLAWSCLYIYFSINEELRSVVKEHFNGKLFLKFWIPSV